MRLFLVFGLIGTVELVVLFGIIHALMSYKKKSKHLWLVPVMAFLLSYGYAFNIFVIEGEGKNSFSGAISEGLFLYLFVFTFFATMFRGLFALAKSALDKKK